MGTEYRIKLTAEDFAHLRSALPGRSLDDILRSAPGFVANQGNSYSYRQENVADDQWLATVDVQEDGIWLCYNSDTALRDYLMARILETCGRLSIEDG